jgi:hypothetical protein
LLFHRAVVARRSLGGARARRHVCDEVEGCVIRKGLVNAPAVGHLCAAEHNLVAIAEMVWRRQKIKVRVTMGLYPSPPVERPQSEALHVVALDRGVGASDADALPLRRACGEAQSVRIVDVHADRRIVAFQIELEDVSAGCRGVALPNPLEARNIVD